MRSAFYFDGTSSDSRATEKRGEKNNHFIPESYINNVSNLHTPLLGVGKRGEY